MRSAEEWANELDRRIRQSVMNPGLEDFTEAETHGEMNLMMKGVWFPKRWMTEALRAYARECVKEKTTLLEEVYDYYHSKRSRAQMQETLENIAAALRALPGETP